jgi:hypothetical protein
MADQFCEKCRAESTDETAGSYTEGMFGREFMGQARRCPDCDSWVATLWQVFLHFPMTPIGTFRYKQGKVGFGKVTFFTRKVPLDEEQVRSTRTSGTIMAILVFAIAAGLLYWKYH